MTGIPGRSIGERVQYLLRSVPADVVVLAAAKLRTPDEIRAALDAGLGIIGENYVQEALAMQTALGRGGAEWHLIGHLQRNKAKDAVHAFDLIQTLDSMRLGGAVDAAARAAGRIMPVLVEVNSGREPQKAGVLPENAADLVQALDRLDALQVLGLMTMGPVVADPEALRTVFRDTRRLFETFARENFARARMSILSMGMSNSYRVAIEEGATMVRIGSALFGPRDEGPVGS
ncbi:MAG: YggS family pyridoxal phosphate-dependent enzyme [Candidatus Bipolaricaulota bacterium]